MGVVDRDKGYHALVDRIFTLGKPTVSVGIFESDGALPHGEAGMTVADLANIHEFGLGVPERSFLRGWFDENIDRAREALRLLLLSVVEGKRSKEQALELFGLWLQAEVQKRIAAGIQPGLAARTIERKGSSTPLIDTGQLRSSVTYQIDNGAGGIKQGTSEAAVQRHEKAKAEKRAAKATARKEATARRRATRAARKQVVKSVKKVAKKGLKNVKKIAKKGVKKVTKRRR